MKPFDLEKALAGAPVVTRDGSPVTQLTLFDVPEGGRLYGVVEGCVDFWWNRSGEYRRDAAESSADLFMAPIKRKGWVIKRKDNDAAVLSTTIFDTEEAAKLSLSGDQYVYIKLEWEE